MIKISKIYPRDIIALVCLIAIFILIALGHNGWLQGVGAVIIGYYFSKRMYEEENPNGDLNKKVQTLETKVQENKVEADKILMPLAKSMLPGEVIVKKIIH